MLKDIIRAEQPLFYKFHGDGRFVHADELSARLRRREQSGSAASETVHDVAAFFRGLFHHEFEHFSILLRGICGILRVFEGPHVLNLLSPVFVGVLFDSRVARGRPLYRARRVKFFKLLGRSAPMPARGRRHSAPRLARYAPALTGRVQGNGVVTPAVGVGFGKFLFRFAPLHRHAHVVPYILVWIFA